MESMDTRTINELYPVFLKVDQLQILLVGGGYVALEKLSFLYKSSPQAQVTLVAPMIRPETAAFIQTKAVRVLHRKFRFWDLRKKHLVIVATDQPNLNEKIALRCRQKALLVNVADTPNACDFYMGSIVTKGNLKIAFSTNGKSPTIAKRLRQWLEDIFPEEMDALLETMLNYRKQLKGDFETKVKILNEHTQKLIATK